MSVTQAEILRSVLIDLGLVAMPGSAPRQSGDLDTVYCFVGQMPDGYSRVLSIYDRGGLAGGREMNGGRRNVMPGVALLFRDLDGTAGYRRGTDFAQAVAKALDERISMTATVVPEDEQTHTIQAVTRTTAVTHLGEETGKKRNHWSLNARLSFPASEPTHG